MKNDIGQMVATDQLWIAARQDNYHFILTPCARLLKDGSGVLTLEVIRFAANGVSRSRHRTRIQLSAGRMHVLSQLQFTMLDNEWVQVHVSLQQKHGATLEQHWIPSMLLNNAPVEMQEPETTVVAS